MHSAFFLPQLVLQAVHHQVEHGGDEEGQELAEDEASDDGDAEGAARFGARAETKGDREGPCECGHGCHHDGAEPYDARFVYRVRRGLAFLPLGFEREIDHHDPVLLYEADQHYHADIGVDREVDPEDHQGKKRAEAGEGERRKYGQWMDETFIKDAEDKVDDENGEEEEPAEALHAGLENLGGPLEAVGHSVGNCLPRDLLDQRDRVPEGHTRLEVEGNGHRGDLAGMIDRQRADILGDDRDGGDGDERSRRGRNIKQ